MAKLHGMIWVVEPVVQTPHVASVVALIYQAYKDAHGKFPTSEKARDILMSSATDIDEEIFSGFRNSKCNEGSRNCFRKRWCSG